MAGGEKRTIAVVAVHGVADQQPNATARTIADVLSRIPGGEGGTYSAFEESALRVPVASTLPLAGATPMRAPLMRVQQSSQVFETFRQPERRAGDSTPPSEDLGHLYMKDLLSKYTPDVKDSIFETIRLEGVRDGGECRVHVYEAYWADLSRLASGVLSAVIDLYQLLFYVCSLGRKTIASARTVGPQASSRWWRAFGQAHSFVEWPLVLGVPILNLTLLALAGVLFTIKLPNNGWAIPLCGIASVVLAAAVGTGLVLYVTRMRFRGSLWPVAGLVVAVMAVLFAALARLLFSHGDSYRLLGFIVFGLLGLLLVLLMTVYQRRRSFAFPTAVVLVVGVAIFLGWRLHLAGGPEDSALVRATLESVELVLAVLALCWLVIMLAIVATSVFGAGAVRWGTPVARQPAARRAAWTANLSVVLPAVAVIVLNLAVWSGVHAGGTRILTELKRSPAAGCEPLSSEICYEPIIFSVKAGTAGYVMGSLLDRSLRPLPLIVPVGALALLSAVWFLLPAAAGEFPKLAGTGPAATAWLGASLSTGFRAMRFSGELLRWLFFVLAGIGLLVALNPKLDREIPAWPILATLLGAGVTLAVSASKGPLRFLALGFRSALDIALDVTNWLRLQPADRNPRSRICARYSSLLRHICRWRDPVTGRGYDAIVIVAHSQGTVITTELLRFMRQERTDIVAEYPELARLYDEPGRLPIYLFTMGCPLRQLYGLRFPDLYDWAWHEDGAWPGSRPDAGALGVEAWANAYRSGDYVGRYLWFPDSGDARWQATESTHDIRLEYCAGPGAHTHYWDQQHPDMIGATLDALIRLACRAAGP